MSDDDDTLDLFSPEYGRMLRDEGVALVDGRAGEWKDRARQLVLDLVPVGWEGLAEDIRVLLLGAGLPLPHSPNCWGSLMLWGVREKLFVWTGQLSQMRDPRSHARCTKVYRRTS